RPVSLSPRQRQMLSLLKAGKTNKEIAAELGIGIGTVKQHLVTLFRKLGVTNRSMAISKSLSLDGVNIEGPTALDEEPASAMESMLERRPAAVLSLETVIEDGELPEAEFRDIYKIYAEVAFDFGAVFLSHRGGRCDMVFGVRRVRRHDVLRAIRAAVAVSEDVAALSVGRTMLRAGLAFGFIFASTDGRGEWTGEAIGGPVISAARTLLTGAPAGRIALHDSVRRVMRAMGVGTSGNVPGEVPLNRRFRWKRQLPVAAATLHGRLVEIETLRGHMKRSKRDARNAAFVEGESGMGKSALVGELAALATREGLATETWMCSIPDSQPGSPSLDRLENVKPPSYVPPCNTVSGTGGFMLSA
ncbi:MAG: LuxR C-terminal-related transcriptional regulator, partial [Rhodospirillaceae bacterium]|nr:LuxR C-terminal-related transcriptional regulator [Rhodospirillaceae bacterium]